MPTRSTRNFMKAIKECLYFSSILVLHRRNTVSPTASSTSSSSAMLPSLTDNVNNNSANYDNTSTPSTADTTSVSYHQMDGTGGDASVLVVPLTFGGGNSSSTTQPSSSKANSSKSGEVVDSNVIRPERDDVVNFLHIATEKVATGTNKF